MDFGKKRSRRFGLFWLSTQMMEWKNERRQNTESAPLAALEEIVKMSHRKLWTSRVLGCTLKQTSR